MKNLLSPNRNGIGAAGNGLSAQQTPTHFSTANLNLGSKESVDAKDAETRWRSTYSLQANHVDALLENVWPQVEQAGLNKAMRLFENGSNVPIQSGPTGVSRQRSPECVDRVPQRCLGANDIRTLSRETPVDQEAYFRELVRETPVDQETSSTRIHFDASGGQVRVNEAESLQRCAAELQERSGSRIPVPLPFGDAPGSPARTPGENFKDTQRGAPCTNAPCKSSMPEESKEQNSGRTEALANVGMASQPQQNAVGGQGRDGLLVVHYREGEQPMSEILRLEGGLGFPVTVEAVAVGSKAARAGITPGYALVAMNGRNEFTQLPGWQVRLLLESPITLGFDRSPKPIRSQVGVCTEIRLKRVQESIGVPTKLSVFGPQGLGMLAEEVVFKPGSAPLFIKSENGGGGEAPAVGAPPWSPQAEGNQPHIYELRHNDAQVLVGRAVHGARAVVESTLEAECVVHPNAQRYSWRSLSPVGLMSECVSGQETTVRGNASSHPQAPKQYFYHKSSRPRSSSPRNETDLKRPVSAASSNLTISSSFISGIANVQELNNREFSRPYEGEQASPRSSSRDRCGCGLDDDEDSWLNFQSSRSPLRWLAPVLEPVVRAFSPSRSPSRTMPPIPESNPRPSRGSSPRPTTQNIFAGMTSNSNNRGNEQFHHAAASSSLAGNASTRRGRNEIHSNAGREKGISGTVRQTSPNQSMRPTSSSPIPSRTSLGSPVRNVHSLSGPRSQSPQSRVPAGDSSVDVVDYDEHTGIGVNKGNYGRMPVLPLSRSQHTQPSFSVSWKNDMLNGDNANKDTVKGISLLAGPRQGRI